jgi:hypothetical protein
LVYLAVESQRNFQDCINGFLIHDGQHARKTQANGTSCRIWWCAVSDWARAKQFGTQSGQFHMNFTADVNDEIRHLSSPLRRTGMRFAFKGMLPSLAIPFTLPIITLPRCYFPHPTQPHPQKQSLRLKICWGECNGLADRVDKDLP